MTEGRRAGRPACALAAAGALVVACMAALAVEFGDDVGRAALLDVPVHVPTAAGTARSAMPRSWLSSADEQSSPLLQDSSDNAVQVLATSAAAQSVPATAQASKSAPEHGAISAPSVAALADSAVASVPVPPVRTAIRSPPGAATTDVPLQSRSGIALAGQHTGSVKGAAVGSRGAQAESHALPQQATHEQAPRARHESWKDTVRKAEAAADALAERHPRSVLGAHWRDASGGASDTLQEASAAAAKAGQAAEDQLVQLAKDHLKAKGIYAPAAMCEKDKMPCPGTLEAKETSEGHYTPVRDNGPAPGKALPAGKSPKSKTVMPAPARYPAVSFYAKIREEASEHARLSRAGTSRHSTVDMLALKPGEHGAGYAHTADAEHRALPDGSHRRGGSDDGLRGDERRGDDGADLDRRIRHHLYRMFVSKSRERSARAARHFEAETRPSASALESRDSIRGLKRDAEKRRTQLYEGDANGDDEDEEDTRVNPREEEEQRRREEEERRMRHAQRVKEAQERMARRWRQMMADPPRSSRATRPDLLDPRELLVPRVGFNAKKKELDDFKSAIEMYEADPEMNPMTVLQAHHLAKYGVMPPESDSPRDWQAWYREATDKAQVLSDQIAVLAKPVVDPRHRWDHGGPGDWCGTGGCRTMAHEQHGDRYMPGGRPKEDELERRITDQMQRAVVSGEDAGGGQPSEVTVSDSAVSRREPSALRSRDDAYAEARIDGHRRDRRSSHVRQWRRTRRQGRQEEWRFDHRRQGRGFREEREGGGRRWQGRRQNWRRERGAEMERRRAPGVRDDSHDFSDDYPARYASDAGDAGAAVGDDEAQSRSVTGRQLVDKVDTLEDEVQHLVKMLSRRRRRAAGQTTNVAGGVNAGQRAELEASHVVDWLRGAIRAASGSSSSQVHAESL